MTLWITTWADRVGRRRMLVAGAGLMLFAAIVFALTRNFYLLLLAATIGVISPSGGEVGPFLSIEQAALAQETPGGRRTGLFAWYNLAGSLATATGALTTGWLIQGLRGGGFSPYQSYRAAVVGYALIGLCLAFLFSRLSAAVELIPTACGGDTIGYHFGLGRSRGMVLRLSGLFALDAFGGGFVPQSIMAYWFHVRFGASPALLGSIFFGANILAGLSALSAARIASRIGLIRTMVFTHLPSNVLLVLVPLMPSLPLAIAVLLLRFSISQMDVPTRQSYVMAVVGPEERSAAAGVTNIARTLGASLSPMLTGIFLATPALLGLPFFLSGGLKSIYDLALFRSFRAHRPPEEHERR